jgi:Protein of unknown function (DUF2855)
MDVRVFEVDRAEHRRWRVVPVPEQSLEIPPGSALLAIDRFGFSANNITYVATGETLGYWQHFPAPAGWGRVPVWGYATVCASRHARLPQGQRVFGYLPLATHLRVQPEFAAPADGAAGFLDATEHRVELPLFYRRYALLAPAADDAATRDRDDLIAILRPLYLTALLVVEQLRERVFDGATHVLLTSASSKTALAVADGLRRAAAPVQLVGLTSARHLAFCRATGCYDQVLDYQEIESLPREAPALSLDFAGNADLLRRIHVHLAALKRSITVGLTHHDAVPAAPRGRPGPKAEFFFAPTEAERRLASWGEAELRRRSGAAFDAFVTGAADWLRLCRASGEAAVAQTYQRALAGEIAPDEALVLSL